MPNQKKDKVVDVKVNNFTAKRLEKLAKEMGKTPSETAIFFLNQRCITPAERKRK